MKFARIFILLLISVISLPGITLASVSATGEFTAAKACPAYQSMRKKTNPGNAALAINRAYPIIEVNKDEAPGWYRIIVDGATPRERWVSAECGSAGGSSGKGGTATANGGVACQTAGREDGYVFAVSWQPAFCEEHRSKPECKVNNPNSFQARHFTLHGLWPNQSGCGTNYGFCGKYKAPVESFCDFDPVPMSDETRKRLSIVMPSAAFGSCLQRHEWYKHGSCQTEWSADGYFEQAMALLAEFNGNDGSGIAAFMASRLGKRISVDDLNSAIDQALGPAAHKRMEYGCNRDGKLQDIYINLPAKIGNESLRTLIQRAPEKYRNKCGKNFVVDPIGY